MVRCEVCLADDVEVEPVDDSGDGMVFCLSCGEEFNIDAAKYKNFAVGVVLSAAGIPKKDLKKTTVDVGNDKILQIVTNGHVDVGDFLIVAMEGAIVPAGSTEDEDAITVKPMSVGSVKSEGMFCDSPMLAWKGGCNGVIQKLDSSSYLPGQSPPNAKPSTRRN